MNKTLWPVKNCIILLLPIFFFIKPVFAQTPKSKVDSFFTNTPILIQGSFNPGRVFPTNDFVRGQNFSHDTIDEYKSLSLLFLKQTTGSKLWEQLYNYPVYGIGIYTATFKETNELGTPVAVFGYFSAPFVRRAKIKF